MHMTGHIHTVITRRTFDFSKVQSGQTQDVPLVRAIDVTNAKALELIVRVHSRTITAGQVDVIAQAVSLTAEEPDTDFVYGTALGTITLNTAAPVLHLANLTAPFGHMVRIILRATGGASATITVGLSIDLRELDN